MEVPEYNQSWGLFKSAGGFSNIFPVADYQANAISSYLNENTFSFKSYNVTAGDSVGAKGGVFNIAGRGYPDVSANGAKFDMYLHGKPYLGNAGTSLAAPIWAGIVTLVSLTFFPCKLHR
jgi:tripeptidyl-peptidase I